MWFSFRNVSCRTWMLQIDEVNVFIVHSDMRSTAVEEKSNSSDMHIYPTQQDEDELISLQNITEVCVGSENKKDRRAKVPSRELTHVLTTFSALPSLDSTFPITLESCFRHYTGTEVSGHSLQSYAFASVCTVCVHQGLMCV